MVRLGVWQKDRLMYSVGIVSTTVETTRNTAVSNDNIFELKSPEESVSDLLTEMVRRGVKEGCSTIEL